ncbi:MAG: TetR/AcrR family transcriptional regulator [Chloroflexi bacterium]|nr:TetR/AcrR family transcriptional regulator [Chloroflexota bacterium]
MTRRTESEAVRRKQILTAARRVFRDKGYDKTTVSDIVNEAGVAQGTFYLYYPSKKAVVLALGQMMLEEISLRMRDAYAPGLSFEDRIRKVIHVAFKVGRENVDLCRLIHLGAESVAQELHETMADHPVQIEMVKMFCEASDAGEMRDVDPEMAVRLLFRMMPSCLQEAYVFSDGKDAQRLEAAMAQILIGGLVRQG